MTESSIEALDYSIPRNPSARFRTLLTLQRLHRATCSDIEAALNGKHQAVSARMDDLTLMGLVSPSFGRRERKDQPSESIYGLTPAGVRVLAHKDRAYEIVAALGVIRDQVAAERAEAMRALKRDWRSHIADSCRETADRLCPPG